MGHQMRAEDASARSNQSAGAPPWKFSSSGMLSNNCRLPGARLVSQSAALELTITYHPVGEAAYPFAASKYAVLVRESGGSARPTDEELPHTMSTVGFQVPPTRRGHHQQMNIYVPERK